jgi:hypothetical protein
LTALKFVSLPVSPCSELIQILPEREREREKKRENKRETELIANASPFYYNSKELEATKYNL